MKVVIDNPPMIDEIDAVFHVRGAEVLFCWGDTIYNPTGVAIPSQLMAHEGVHGSRQTNDENRIRTWWEQYLIDPQFRFQEELPAHRAEYKALAAKNRDRNQRSRFAHHVAERLAAPLYGSLVTKQAALSLLLKG